MLRPLQWGLAGLALFFLNRCAVNQTHDVQIYWHVLNTGRSGSVLPYHTEDPLTLKNALILANTHNEQMAIAGEDYLQTLIDKDRAFAAFLPTISFAPTFMLQGKTAYAANNPLIAEFEPNHTTDLPVAGNMDLHLFRDVPALQTAGAFAKMQRAVLLDRQALLMLDVARTYFQVMHSEKQVAVLKYSIKVARQRLADIQVKEKTGVARPVDVFLAESQLAKTQNELIQAKADVKNGRAMLAFLIGVPAVKGPLTGGLKIPSINWHIDTLLKLTETHRQDLTAAHERVKAAAAALEAAWGEYFPSVSLNLMRYLSRDTFPNDVDWTSMIQVNVPIFQPD
ncbi:TolC family protein [Dissulfurimicrobium hydrothermale]|uniref:TolC family protein n=3 Tax=Dissulfurimicrobium TaxID=1769732 RepID=UPI001EDC23DD|nr:TolC family protein [Dissulfurimicrobium hydrothermale]